MNDMRDIDWIPGVGFCKAVPIKMNHNGVSWMTDEYHPISFSSRKDYLDFKKKFHNNK
tara:strand:- start:64 stop:237 length:174 start_codon:yes stop_codon:yes gene_type:complete